MLSSTSWQQDRIIYYVAFLLCSDLVSSEKTPKISKISLALDPPKITSKDTKEQPDPMPDMISRGENTKER